MPNQQTRKIQLTHGKSAIVDADRYNELNQYTWRAVKSDYHWYAIRRFTIGGRTRTIKMHRQIANTPLDMVCHHKNGYSLDNRIDNLQNLYPLAHKMHHQLLRHCKKQSS